MTIWLAEAAYIIELVVARLGEVCLYCIFHTIEIYYSDVCCFLVLVLVVGSLALGVVSSAAKWWRSRCFLPVCLQASSDKKSDWGGESPAPTADQFPPYSTIFLPFLATWYHFLSVGLLPLPPIPAHLFIFLYPTYAPTSWKLKRFHSRESTDPEFTWTPQRRHLVVWRCRWTEPAAVVQVELRFRGRWEPMSAITRRHWFVSSISLRCSQEALLSSFLSLRLSKPCQVDKPFLPPRSGKKFPPNTTTVKKNFWMFCCSIQGHLICFHPLAPSRFSFLLFFSVKYPDEREQPTFSTAFALSLIQIFSLTFLHEFCVFMRRNGILCISFGAFSVCHLVFFGTFCLI